jgi:hypothetical protein
MNAEPVAPPSHPNDPAVILATFPEAPPRPRRQRGRTLPADRPKEWHVRAPWPWVLAAGRLPGKALLVGLALWRVRGRKKGPIGFSLSRLEKEGVPLSTARRALAALEAARLIVVERPPGQKLKVLILAAPVTTAAACEAGACR